MKMVLLAAGHGRRFGGLKQLAPVGPDGEALIDYTVHQAARAGYRGVVLVVREDIRAEMLDHARGCWPKGFPVDVVVQGRLAGTVPAVLAAAEVLDGPFAVANADDLYDESVFATIAAHFDSGSPRHVLVSYRLANTVLTPQPVKRGLCLLDEESSLADLVEHHICARPDGAYDAVPLYRRPDEEEPAGQRILLGDEPVSMNLWGFAPQILGRFGEAAAAFSASPTETVPGQPPDELLLPELVGRLVRERREQVAVVETLGRCVGLTHREDVAFVQAALAEMPLLQRHLSRTRQVKSDATLVTQGNLATR